MNSKHTQRSRLTLQALALLALVVSCKKEPYEGKDPYAGAKEPVSIKIDKSQATPASGATGSSVTIKGQGFFKYKDSGLAVMFNGVQGVITSVTENALSVKVPEGASTGLITLSVQRQVFPGPKFRVLGPVTIDQQFASVPGADKNGISSITFVPGGKYLIGGNFEDYDNSGAKDGYHGLARINSNGHIDRDFKIGKGFDGNVTGTVIQSDGKIIAVGNFSDYDSRYGGGLLSRIARLNDNGSMDSIRVTDVSGKNHAVPALNAYFDGEVTHVLQTADSGKLIVFGKFKYFMRKNFAGISVDGKRDSTIVDSVRMEGLARLNEDGTFDPNFHLNPATNTSFAGPNGEVKDVLLQDDGKIIMAGTFTKFRDQQTGRIVRLNPDGTIDGTFNTGTGPDNTVESIAPINGGKLLAVGAFMNFNGKETRKVVVLQPNGTADPGFTVGTGVNAGPDGLVHFGGQLKNGKIFISGGFGRFSGVKREGTVILDADGKVSQGYNTMGSLAGRISRMLHVPNSSATVAVGYFSEYDLIPVSRIMLLRY